MARARRVTATTSLRARGELTVPAELRKAARLEPGDPVEMEMTEEGILLRPQKRIDSAQAWFWTPEWQEGEREAEADIRAGALRRDSSDEDFLASFEGD